MERMSAADRKAWRAGSGAAHRDIIRALRAGAYRCDNCDAAAVALTHHGIDTPTIAECAVHVHKRLADERATRPSRAELVARVNASIARAVSA